MHDEEVFIGLVAILLIFGMPIIWLVLHYCYATAKIFFEVRLKRDMVARGFSAQEIAHVIRCPSEKSDAYQAHGIPPAKSIQQPHLQSN